MVGPIIGLAGGRTGGYYPVLQSISFIGSLTGWVGHEHYYDLAGALQRRDPGGFADGRLAAVPGQGAAQPAPDVPEPVGGGHARGVVLPRHAGGDGAERAAVRVVDVAG